MLDALAAAVVLGGLNALVDFISTELRLQTHALYAPARVALICYCAGGLAGARAKQLLIGVLCGLFIGVLVAGTYLLLSPALGWGAVALAWVLFWIGFGLAEAVLTGGIGASAALLLGVIAALLSGAAYYLISGVWTEPAPKDPNYLRVLAIWIGTFFPGFLVLHWNRW